MSAAKPAVWIESFQRFCRFQNGGRAPEAQVEVQLLLHAVPKESTPGKKILLRARQEDYKAAERAEEYSKCLVFLYEILKEEEKEEMVRRTILN